MFLKDIHKKTKIARDLWGRVKRISNLGDISDILELQGIVESKVESYNSARDLFSNEQK